MVVIPILFVLSVPAVALNGSHSLGIYGTYSKGQTPFPQYSATVMLDDITVGYFDSNTQIYIPRGNTTDESHVIDPKNVNIIYVLLLDSFLKRSFIDGIINGPEELCVYQTFCQCELSDNGDPGLMITRDAARGVTIAEVRLLGNNFTYHGILNSPEYKPHITEEDFNKNLKQSEEQHKTLHYPTCISALKNYLNTRASQLNRKIKPTVKMIQKPHSASGGSRVSCLATGFYPHHINLTLFRDGQSVSDHEIIGGDLLPNDDGTYRIRKSLEISAEKEQEKHNYTCSVTHISLDNKLDISLEFNPGVPFELVIPLVVVILLLVFGTLAAIFIWRKWHKASENHEDTTRSYYDCLMLK